MLTPSITSAKSRWPAGCRSACRAPVLLRPLNWPTLASRCCRSGLTPGGLPSALAGRATPSGPRDISADPPPAKVNASVDILVLAGDWLVVRGQLHLEWRPGHHGRAADDDWP